MPVLTKDNHIFSCKSVGASVVTRVEKAIGETIPDEVKSAGKLFRKYLGNLLTGQRETVKQMMGNRRKKPDSWGAILDTATNEYYGKNIMGRLLME